MCSRATLNAPVCGNCGYCVIGLPSDVCPECGISISKMQDIFLPWERRRSCGFLSAFFGTIVKILVSPQRTVHGARLRLTEPIPRLVGFLGWMLATCAVISALGVMLQILTQTVWQSGRVRQSFRVLWIWLESLSLGSAISEARSFFVFVGISASAITICALAARGSLIRPVTADVAVVFGGCWSLPILLLRIGAEIMGGITIGPRVILAIDYGTIAAFGAGMICLGCIGRVVGLWRVLLCCSMCLTGCWFTFELVVRLHGALLAKLM